MTAITIPSGSPAAGLTRPPAQRGRAVNAQSDRAEHREPRSGALDRPAARSYPAPVPSHQPHMSPEPGCVIHTQISDKDSDAAHRCLKRYLARRVWHLLQPDPATTIPTGTPSRPRRVITIHCNRPIGTPHLT